MPGGIFLYFSSFSGEHVDVCMFSVWYSEFEVLWDIILSFCFRWNLRLQCTHYSAKSNANPHLSKRQAGKENSLGHSSLKLEYLGSFTIYWSETHVSPLSTKFLRYFLTQLKILALSISQLQGQLVNYHRKAGCLIHANGNPAVKEYTEACCYPHWFYTLTLSDFCASIQSRSALISWFSLCPCSLPSQKPP